MDKIRGITGIFHPLPMGDAPFIAQFPLKLESSSMGDNSLQRCSQRNLVSIVSQWIQQFANKNFCAINLDHPLSLCAAWTWVALTGPVHMTQSQWAPLLVTLPCTMYTSVGLIPLGAYQEQHSCGILWWENFASMKFAFLHSIHKRSETRCDLWLVGLFPSTSTGHFSI